MLRRLFIPLLTQITVPYLLLALAVAAGSTYIVTRLTFESVEERFKNQLLDTGDLAKEVMVRQEENLLSNVRLLTNIQGVDAAVQLGDIGLLQSLLVPAAINGGVEYLIVLDSLGRPLASQTLDANSLEYVSFTSPANLIEEPFVADVLNNEQDASGDKYAGLIIANEQPLFFISAPVKDAAGQVVGAVLVGRSAGDLAVSLRQQTVAQITLYGLDGQVLASTLLSPRALTSVESELVIASQDQGSQIDPITDLDDTYVELRSTWEARDGQDLGVIGVALASNVLVETSLFTRDRTIWLTSLTLLSVVLVGLWVARRITLPISNLKSAAQRVSEGNLHVRVPVGGQDEIGVLAQSFNEMVVGLGKSKQDLLDAYERTIEGWAKATDMRDHETEGHSRRVTELATALAESMGIKGEELAHLRRGALLHDIGKIAIPDSILLKKGKLTDEERAQMQEHPKYARQFMEQIEFLKPALEVPYSHHEKWDGSGYPQGLKGTKIPLTARIFAIVDVWDALTSDRPYRDALSFDETLKHIIKGSGQHFDPQVVEAFTKMMGR